MMTEERIQRTENEDGIFQNISWQFNDIKIDHNFSTFNKHASFVTSRPGDAVRLHFGLKGNYCFTYHQLNSQFDLIGGHHNLMFSEGFDIAVQNRTLELETFGVQFARRSFIAITQDASDELKIFCDLVENGKSAILSNHWGTINSEIGFVIRQITNCRYSGRMKQILMLSKCLELLVLSVEGCISASSGSATFINNKNDKERIIAARDMINRDLQSPPTLSEVAMSVGLNELKLNRGFKEMFNTTVFGYLAEERLMLGYQYLQETQKTVAEIGYTLGYASPQHFNNAFKKRFGITPFTVKKKR
ncbi:helix-turn-helix transcriptional regulator [Dyadobacter chenhuakuii]|uniref:AraC family transcriptional regulator n=1 Tax=Dyadobacter chenhuakuii TaxID=2909339 RepID=A0A9X1TQD6_9BACT|nr:AraC family transcriptional regulator [Dyadobacter chenhuakuii]MCF2496674.1 AraC family transcriptional regulator [Dyadobacter chenhuakuii]